MTAAARTEILGELLREAAQSAPDTQFVRLADEWITHGALDLKSDRLSGGLRALGVKKGDRVGIILPNCMEYVVAIFAIAKLGAVQVPVNTYLRGEFLRHQLGEPQASIIIADNLGLRQIAPIIQALPDLKAVVSVGPCDVSLPIPIESYDALLSSGATAATETVTPDDLSIILYTSGTTGASKGCMLTHGYHTFIPKAFEQAGWYREGDRIFGANPLFHASGQIWLVLTALSCGGQAIVEPAFHASKFMRRAGETEATVFNAMGAMVAAILAQPPSDTDRAHCLRQGTCVPTTPATWEQFNKRFGVPLNSEVFGQTEFYPATITPAGSKLTPGGAGKAAPHVEIKIFDDADREVSPDEIGEIVLRPKIPRAMFSGYFNNPTATVHSFRNLWHHTGDFGRIDKEGTLFFVDRKKDAMRRRGENVSSMELEEALRKHEGIAAVAVHAVPSELIEDDIKACIVPKDGHTLTAASLFDFFKRSLPYYAIPRYIELMDELPSNAVGRVQKFVLREKGITPNTWDLEAMGLVVERSERRN